jgi:hypothetical protein
MIAYPVSRYLMHFGAAEEVVVEEDVDVILQPLSTKAEELIENQAAELEAAREEGRIEAQAAAQAHLEMTLQELGLDFERRLAEARAAWVAEESAKLSLALTNALTQLEDLVTSSVEAILRPFVIAALRLQIIDELASNVSVLLANDCPLIEISGAADIVAALQEKFSPAQLTIDYRPDESTDVRIVAGHTVIESQLSAWIKRFDLSKEQN